MTNIVGTVIESSEDYEVIIASVIASEIIVDDTEYALRNKKYGIIEVRTPIYPQALEYLSSLQAGIDARRAISEEVEAGDTPSGDVVNMRDVH